MAVGGVICRGELCPVLPSLGGTLYRLLGFLDLGVLWENGDVLLIQGYSRYRNYQNNLFYHMDAPSHGSEPIINYQDHLFGEFLHLEWQKVTQKQCARLVESMPRHMEAVTKNKVYYTNGPGTWIKTFLS